MKLTVEFGLRISKGSGLWFRMLGFGEFEPGVAACGPFSDIAQLPSCSNLLSET